MLEALFGTRPDGMAIVPRRSVAGRTLMLLIAIMTFLSCITLGGVILVQQSAIAWSSEIGRELTIQVRPVEGADMEANIRDAVALAESTNGVGSAQALSTQQGTDLLEPWLGAGLDLTSLEIPRLIVVTLDDPRNADIEALRQNLSASVPGATLETHALWRQQLNAMAGTLVISGTLVLLLILAATALAIVFATRGTMAQNRDIVDVLHFIGASNRYIATAFQGRFLTIGLQGGAIGGGGALVFFMLASFITASVLPAPDASQLTTFFGGFLPGLAGLFGLVVMVLVMAGLTAWTSRLTVNRFLSQIGA
jgi:cell division transport system permease protein